MVDHYRSLRAKWTEILIGKYDVLDCGKQVREVIVRMDQETHKWLDGMNHEEDRTYLWEDKSDFGITQTQTDCYRRLLEMSKSFCMEGSVFYKNLELLGQIKKGLSLLYEKAYNTSFDPYYGNWWNWEIGTPISLGNILCLLWDELSEEEIKTYSDVIYFFQPNPRHSGLRTFNDAVRNRVSVGGNRIDTAKVAALLGMVTENKEQLMMARDSLSDTFKKVKPHQAARGEKRDGLYEDWSFIQHGDVPYTGTYGNVLLGGLGELVNLLSDTPWEVVDPEIENIYAMILNTFAPILYKGNCMELVNGRGASREEWQNNRTGHSIINSIMWFTKFAPAKYVAAYKALIRYWIESDNVRDYIATNNNINMIEMAQAILLDHTIVPSGELVGTFSFNSMDRIIHRKENFTFGLSMHSSRIRTYEDMNGENRKGFHTSDGMTYIYNGDQKEYTHDFWATVDPYKLSGITVDTKKLEDGEGYFRTAENWVSTMSYKNCYGIAGMQLNKQGVDEQTEEIVDTMDMDLKAKKSYFMLDREIVALGAHISSTKDRKIETIVDTRKMKKDFSNKVIVDGSLLEPQERISIKDASYIYLEGNSKGTSMGYYFPQKQDIEVEPYTRQASWYEVNNNSSKEIKEQAYITFTINHGSMPQDEEYAYVLVPNATEESMRAYEKNENIHILENSWRTQAIEYNNLLMANFWQEGPSYIGDLKVNTKASVIIEENSDTIEVSVCDPTKSNEGFLILELDRCAKEVIEKVEEVEITSLEESIQLKINLNDNRGKSYTIKLGK